ncbi:MAG: hypothetical protein Q4P29_02360 [Tissierellia bacterium]|nr:hypothetical protein [Tissierellia bacterium]
MFKLLKYEHKGSRKFMTILIAVFAIALFFTMLMARNMLNNVEYKATNFNATITLLGAVIITGTLVTFLFYMLSILRRDLYQDTGYLTFSLPLNGFQIIGAKLLNIVIWAILFAVFGICIFILFGTFMYDGFWQTFVDGLNHIISQVHIKNIILYAILSTSNLFNLYLSFALAMILGKALFKNGKMSWLWILIFFLIQYLFARLSAILVYPSGSLSQVIFGGPQTFYYPNTPDEAYIIMLKSLTFNIALGTIMFLISSVLWEKKVEI